MNYVLALQHQSVAMPEPALLDCRQRQVGREESPQRVGPRGEYQAPVASGESDMRPLIIERVQRLSAGLTEGARFVLDELLSLLEEEEFDDRGVLRPTQYAFKRSLDLIYQAALQLREHFPPAAVSTDNEGGCRIQWILPRRQVRLIIPAQEGGQQYLYHQEGPEYAAVEDVSPQRLVAWLNWLQDAR